MLYSVLGVATIASLGAWTAENAGNPAPIFLERIWPSFAGGAERVSVAPLGAEGPISISSPRWVKSGDEWESFEFYGQSGVVTTPELVIAVGFQTGFPDAAEPDPQHNPLAGPRGQDSVVAFNRVDGSIAWTAPVPIALLDSWSTPAVDAMHNTLILGTGGRMAAISLEDGSEVWNTSLGRIIVNASPAVTHDLGPANRVFITDHSFATGSTGRLYCINTSPHHPALNPYQPGQIVWSVNLQGQTSGNTPAYKDGVVYVSTATGGGTWDQGTIRAYPADATSPPQPLWVYHHTDPSGFFAGMAVKQDAIYASTYSFHGGQFSAATVRLDRATGAQRWSVPTNRTDTIPVPLGNGLVLVSGGVPFTSMFPAFGSLPSLQLIYEHSWSGRATLLWDSAMDTHVDLNNNGQWDPGEPFLSVGGWTNQPVVVRLADGRHAAFVGSAPNPKLDGFFGPSRKLFMIDLTKHPSQPGFIIKSTPGCGGSPALSERELYAVGFGGVHAFGAPVMPRGEILARWANHTLPDFNGNGVVDGQDLMIALQYALD
ncbi:MAG: PQQ-binding-like beta-propeller repeat protein [Phycisphaerales bacterium]|nr:PQQ-like beta-propeller repeat protein [Planctomycetota bacterium]MCH8508422.1 PQQ-binding-like beta-propeller repeat protein [Phycisphaerales bacterium]